MRYGKWVSLHELVDATVVSAAVYEPLTVRLRDGRLVVIVVEHGYDEPELAAYEA